MSGHSDNDAWGSSRSKAAAGPKAASDTRADAPPKGASQNPKPPADAGHPRSGGRRESFPGGFLAPSLAPQTSTTEDSRHQPEVFRDSPKAESSYYAHSSSDNVDSQASRNEDRSATEQFNSTTDWWDPQGSLRTLHDINPTRVAWIAERTGGLDGRRILDVGAGGGILAEALASRGAQVMAIDTAREALQTAKLHAQEQGIEGLQFRCCTVEELASEAERGQMRPFDAVICMELLEHTPDPASVVQSCARLLRTGGNACFSTINRTHKAYALAILGAEYILGLLPKGTHQYNSLIRPAELAKWARDSDLELCQLRGLAYNPITRHAWLNQDTAINYLAHFRRIPCATSAQQ